VQVDEPQTELGERDDLLAGTGQEVEVRLGEPGLDGDVPLVVEEALQILGRGTPRGGLLRSPAYAFEAFSEPVPPAFAARVAKP
jgi:hypothetical protein